jgi:arylsulfatase A
MPNTHRALVLASLVLSVASIHVIAADAPATRPTTQPIVQHEGDPILLHSRNVTVHGTTVRYEPAEKKNTIGYWMRKEDWVSWDFEVTKPGSYELIAMQGCGKGSGGSEVEFSIGDQKQSMVVKDTGGFQNFVERSVGTYTLTAGSHTLSVKPVTKPGQAVMDLRQVILKPVAAEK